MGIRRTLIAAVPVLMLATAACSNSPAAGSGGGSSAGAGTTVAVSESEWAIQPAVDSVGQGPITFDVTNDGTMTHEFVVVKATDGATSLPVEGDEASEDGSAGEVEDVAAGTTKTLTLDLGPGTYILICNIAGHYGEGMHAAFTVS